MYKSEQYVREATDRLDARKDKLQSHYDKTAAMTSLADNSNRLQLNNERVLPDDPVYQSKKAPDEVKKALETRKLGNLSQSDFEDEYKKITYGLQFDKPIKVPEKALTVQNAFKAGHDLQYLNQVQRDYQLTTQDTEFLIDLKLRHHTNFPAMLRLIDRGNSVDEMSELLALRDNVKDVTNRDGSLHLYDTFVRTFASYPIDAEDLTSVIIDANTRVKERTIDNVMRRVLARAKSLDSSDLEFVLDSLGK